MVVIAPGNRQRAGVVEGAVALDAQDLEDYLLSKVPGLAEYMAVADQARARGETRSAADVFAELDAQDRRDLHRAIDKL